METATLLNAEKKAVMVQPKPFWLVSYHLDDVNAGPSIRFQRYAPLFLKKGYRLNFLCRKHDASKPDYEQREFYDVHWVSANERWFHHTLFIFKCLRKAAFSKEKPLAILLFGINSFQLWILPLLKLRSIRIIYVNTMQFSTEFLPGKSLAVRFYNRLHLWIYRLLLMPMLDSVVCSSAELGKPYERLGLSHKKVKVIGNGVNIEVFKPVSVSEQKEFRQKLDLPIHGKLFLFVGLRTERKGILDLLEAWDIFHAKHPDHHLVMVGSEKPSSSSDSFNLRWAEIKENIAKGSTDIILRDSSKQVHEYFKACDVFVFPSKLEGMPNVLLEAMACGLPVVTTAFEGFSKVYGEHEHDLIITKRDAKSIAFWLEKLPEDERLYERLRNNALQRVHEYFKVEQSIKAYSQLIDKRFALITG